MNNYFKTIIVVITAILSISCQPDEPGSHGAVDYGKTRLGRIDLTGAKQLAIKTSNKQQQETDGKYLSEGLYKIDDSGNISTAVMYITTDTLGNSLKREHAIKIVPKELFKVTEDYALAIFCNYYDADCENWITKEDEQTFVRQNVPHRNLLIRLSDGKIWCVDNVLDKFITDADKSWVKHELLAGNWKHDKKGALYLNGVYRFDISAEEVSYERILSGDGYPDKRYMDYHVADNGVIWAYIEPGIFNMTMHWPYSADPLNIVPMDLANNIYNGRYVHYINQLGEKVSEDDNWVCSFSCSSTYGYVVNVDENPGIIFFGKYRINYRGGDFQLAYDAIDDNIASYYEIAIGDTPGEYSLKGDPIILGKAGGIQCDSGTGYTSFGFDTKSISVYSCKDFILVAEYYGDLVSRISKIDLKKREWVILKTVNNIFNFRSYIPIYMGRLWFFNIEPFGAYWLDINTLETGFVAYNIGNQNWLYYTGKFSEGYLTYTEFNEAENNWDSILFDVATGEVIEKVAAPKTEFSTLIDLK